MTFLIFKDTKTKLWKVPSIQRVMFSTEHIVIENSILTLYVSNCSLRILPTLFTTKKNMSFAIFSALYTSTQQLFIYSYLAPFSLLMMPKKTFPSFFRQMYSPVKKENCFSDFLKIKFRGYLFTRFRMNT